MRDRSTLARVPPSMWIRVWALALALCACDVQDPKQQHDATIEFHRDRPHDKPGESLNQTRLCTCTRCEVAECCRELEQDQPEDHGKCESYDFEKCGGLAVSSCEGRCFQHRWRTAVEVSCEDSRPDACCAGDF